MSLISEMKKLLEAKAKKVLDPQNLVTLGVLGGAYKGHRASLKVTLTHTKDLSEPGEKAICGQRNIADEYSSSDDEKAAAPTCPKCLAKDPRFK